ncbi:MAG: hypothetical protein GX034_05435 [Clostridiaceae bacterium]|nr:hypothetical protein [Clostridiaceae bacterium]
MKKHKKLLVLLLAALLLVTATVFVTMAYLTSEEKVENTFTVGKVKIKLDEAKVNEYGEKVLDDNGYHVDRVKANKYKLLPNHEYVKDPTVTVLKDSEESYVRMFVTINNANKLDAIFAPDGAVMSDIFKGYDSTVWIDKGNVKDTVAGTRTYEFWYKIPVDARTAEQVLEPLFTGIKVPGSLTGDDLAKLEDLKIDIVAQAIQADGFADADAAWAEW